MILDLQTMFSGTVAADGTKTGQALTATAISTNVLDLRNAATPAAADEGIVGFMEMWLIVQVQTSANGADAAKTLTITLESSSTADLATSPVVHYATAAITGATLVAGFTAVRTQLPSADYKRFVGLRYTVSAGFTAFNILAYLTPDPQRNVIYPIGFTIDV
jgi:hypothetical protein